MGNNNYISVAIDGPAGAGKSSISKAVASNLGFVYIDTGAMYRSVALYAIENGIDTKNETDKLVSRLDEINIEIKYTADGQRVILNGKDVSKTIRREDVSVGASNVAVIPKVREKLVHMQQEMAKNDNVIMDGRDICSHVLPNAQVKIFLTASTEARAMRRYKELVEKGVECDFDTIKKDMEYRDENDSNRAVSPLHKADDAVLVDTTELNFNQTVERIEELIKNGI
jgi:cytidylate kinase